MEKMYVFNRIYPFKNKEKISLAKADLSKLSNEDLQKLYDITNRRTMILSFKKTLVKSKLSCDVIEVNKKIDILNDYLSKIDNEEQKILQKTI